MIVTERNVGRQADSGLERHPCLLEISCFEVQSAQLILPCRIVGNHLHQPFQFGTRQVEIPLALRDLGGIKMSFCEARIYGEALRQRLLSGGSIIFVELYFCK